VLVSYLLFTFALVATPGSTTAVVVRNTLTGGRAAGLATAAGAALGNTSHATAAGLGLALMLARWPAAFAVVRIGGGAYLAWLGLASLFRVIKHSDGGLPLPAADGRAADPQRGRSFKQGLTVNLLNPAIVTFYLVVVPSFLPQGASRWSFVALAAIHVAMAFACHGVWAIAFDRVRRLFHRPVARRTLEAVSGIALVGLALRVWL
jgi:threonine/homoserine/homoserine lactone efflux protein